MPASRALPEPGEPPTAGARSPRRTPSRSEAKRAAEDGRNGDTARSGERHSMERRTPSRMPGGLASARPSVRSSCARWARLSPGDTLVALVKPHYYEGRRGAQAYRHRAGKASLAALPKAIRSVRASLISGSLGSVVPAA